MPDAIPPALSPADIVAVVPSMRGIIAVRRDGRTYYLPDPYFDGEPQWVELPPVPPEGP